MKDLAVHTRIGPADRVKRLQKFIDDVSRSLLTTKSVFDTDAVFSHSASQSYLREAFGPISVAFAFMLHETDMVVVR